MKKLYKEIGKVRLIICLDSGCGNYEQVRNRFSILIIK